MPRTMDPKVLDALRYALRTGCTAEEAIEKYGAKCKARNLQAHISRHRETKDERRETRGERQETRGERREARDERQETRDE